MPNWIRIAAVDDCPPGEAREFLVEDRIIALFHVGRPVLRAGRDLPAPRRTVGPGTRLRRGRDLPWHGWQFDVTTGQHQANRRCGKPSYPVKVEGQDIFVAVNG